VLRDEPAFTKLLKKSRLISRLVSKVLYQDWIRSDSFRVSYQGMPSEPALSEVEGHTASTGGETRL
jgi:hypothetical protein